MLRIIPYATVQIKVVWVIGVLLLALKVEVVRVAIRPSLYRVITLVAYVLNFHCHNGSFGIERGMCGIC